MPHRVKQKQLIYQQHLIHIRNIPLLTVHNGNHYLPLEICYSILSLRLVETCLCPSVQHWPIPTAVVEILHLHHYKQPTEENENHYHISHITTTAPSDHN